MRLTNKTLTLVFFAALMSVSLSCSKLDSPTGLVGTWKIETTEHFQNGSLVHSFGNYAFSALRISFTETTCDLGDGESRSYEYDTASHKLYVEGEEYCSVTTLTRKSLVYEVEYSADYPIVYNDRTGTLETDYSGDGPVTIKVVSHFTKEK